ncbi:MAG: short chain fatty acid transporter [SAR86 cluster bacterium]|uniref:Short chain fatty acid transporter n=1 Tax=SAR86 cluster bacterium TaxID=2030880 RepID=A0A2A5CCA4_9GAMM|nr:short-chain fatty acid transporter [bacterium AH-315-I11]PCJ41090.1 MAG: short chain fatty acid transporter [SAR86 cluster bacterium]
MQEGNLYIRFIQKFLPSPFSIAIILSLLTYVLALLFTRNPTDQISTYSIKILEYWETGFWELLSFTMQMSLILILGHALALTAFFNKIITIFTTYCTNSAKAALWVSLLTIVVSFINWGLCLVFGAIFARKVAERAKANGQKLNYPLVAAAGYSGMMCWHGGFSGSAPLTIASVNHFLFEQIGQIGIEQTLLSPMNIFTSVLLLIVIPGLFYYLGKRYPGSDITLPIEATKNNQAMVAPTGAERLDHSKLAAVILGFIICFLALRKIWINPSSAGLSFIDLNYINFLLFGLAILLHGSFSKFLIAIQEAVGGAAGIIIQFPLYAGIMGIMNYSGLAAQISDGFVAISNATTLPLFAFLSAGLVNIFVPSGGGQWAVQGPIITEAAQALSISIPKVVMALAYGDQLTNMLQPFWALPLLGITKLRAKDILPYSVIIMLAGTLIFTFSLLVF